MPPVGTAVHVTDCAVVADVGEAEQVAESAAVTVTVVHAPQLLPSFDSVMVLTNEASLSAHTRAYHVPEDGMVYEALVVAETPCPSDDKVLVVLAVTVV